MTLSGQGKKEVVNFWEKDFLFEHFALKSQISGDRSVSTLELAFIERRRRRPCNVSVFKALFGVPNGGGLIDPIIWSDPGFWISVRTHRLVLQISQIQALLLPTRLTAAETATASDVNPTNNIFWSFPVDTTLSVNLKGNTDTLHHHYLSNNLLSTTYLRCLSQNSSSWLLLSPPSWPLPYLRVTVTSQFAHNKDKWN